MEHGVLGPEPAQPLTPCDAVPGFRRSFANWVFLPHHGAGFFEFLQDD